MKTVIVVWIGFYVAAAITIVGMLGLTLALNNGLVPASLLG